MTATRRHSRDNECLNAYLKCLGTSQLELGVNHTKIRQNVMYKCINHMYKSY